MYNKEEIYAFLKTTFIDLFEIEADAIQPDARLYEDLDIDSIDAVDMIIKFKEITGKKIQPEIFKNVRTVQDTVDALYDLVNTDESAQPVESVP